MSNNKRDQKRQFFHISATSHNLGRIATYETFSMSIEIAVTTPSVDEGAFLCHIPSTETPASTV